MLVAIFSVNIKNGFFAMNKGIELPLLYAVAAVALAFTGAGAFSLDTLFGLNFVNEPALVDAVLVLSAAGAGMTLGVRKQDQKQTSAAA